MNETETAIDYKHVEITTEPTIETPSVETPAPPPPETPSLLIVHKNDTLNEEILRLRQENAILAHQNQELGDALGVALTENKKPVIETPSVERYTAAVALAEEALHFGEQGERGPGWNTALRHWIQVRKI